MGDSLGTIIDLMIRKRVLRVRQGDLEVELHPSALATLGQPEGPVASGDACPGCGHSIRAEHNEMGCLLGCANDLCAREVAQA